VAEVVFDTMVIAYALLGFTEFHKESVAALRASPEVWAPELLRVELLSTLWQWTRTRKLSSDLATELLQDGDALVSSYTANDELREEALRLAIARDHSPYDTIFIALALAKGCRLVTYDRPLLTKFPEMTITVANFLK
jgi:predicted nucleic acid-binding protein